MPESLDSRLFESVPDALLVIGRGGIVLRVNRLAEVMFGYPASAMVGQPVEMLIPPRFTGHHAARRDAYIAAPRPRPMGAGLELYALRRDGSEFPVDIMLSPLSAPAQVLTLCAIRDVSDRKDVERLQAALREKEILLREIHHRVKNNLGVISSLFHLQAKTTADAGTLHLLEECRNRVQSMALVHESLYATDNPAEVEFAAYARELSERLVRSHAVPGSRIALRTAMEPVRLSLDHAIPCGIILNELVVNAIVHGFAGGRSGGMSVELRRPDAHACELAVADDGVGVPPTGGEAAGRLGLRLVHALTRQLDGSFSICATHPGTRAVLTWPVEVEHA